MRIVGIETEGEDAGRVQTIDIWYSRRRSVWLVERLNADGDLLGMPHVCASELEATDCLAEWLRAHDETHLVGPPESARMARAVRQKQRRRAA